MSVSTNSSVSGVLNLTASQVQAVQALLDDRENHKVGYENEQPAGITAPVNAGWNMICTFESGLWSATSGTPTLTQGHTGWNGSGAKTGVTSRTGQASMLKVVPAANTLESIQLSNLVTNLKTQAWDGRFALWVYIENLPGYATDTAQPPVLTCEISSTGSVTNGGIVAWNSNQLKEGWNLLKFVARDPAAYTPASGVSEDHPGGVSCTIYGTGADWPLFGTNVGKLKFYWTNMLGATLYFDSMWTGFADTPQVVLGNDGGTNLLTYGLSKLNACGFVGYAALSFNVVDGGTANSTVQPTMMTTVRADAVTLYNAGWDIINHTVTHPNLGDMTSEAMMVYQTEAARAWWLAQGLVRGCEFYASPKSNSSKLSDLVLKQSGFVLQRHARHWNTSVTPWGIDQPDQVGSIDIGSVSGVGLNRVTGGVSAQVAGSQKYSLIKGQVDVAVAYGDTVFLFWHGITTSGDTGSGEDLTGDSLLLTKSAFDKTLDYLKALEAAGSLTVCKGITGFWYGSNA